MHGSRRGRDVAFVSEKGLTKFVFCILKQASSVEFDCLIVERGYALFRGGGLCAAKAARRAQCCWHDNSLLKPTNKLCLRLLGLDKLGTGVDHTKIRQLFNGTVLLTHLSIYALALTIHNKGLS